MCFLSTRHFCCQSDNWRTAKIRPSYSSHSQAQVMSFSSFSFANNWGSVYLLLLSKWFLSMVSWCNKQNNNYLCTWEHMQTGRRTWTRWSQGKHETNCKSLQFGTESQRLWLDHFKTLLENFASHLPDLFVRDKWCIYSDIFILDICLMVIDNDTPLFIYLSPIFNSFSWKIATFCPLNPIILGA